MAELWASGEEPGSAVLPLAPLQLYAVNRRLRALEEQGATWRQRETLIIAVLVSASIANMWLWMNQ